MVDGEGVLRRYLRQTGADRRTTCARVLLKGVVLRAGAEANDVGACEITPARSRSPASGVARAPHSVVPLLFNVAALARRSRHWRSKARGKKGSHLIEELRLALLPVVAAAGQYLHL